MFYHSARARAAQAPAANNFPTRHDMSVILVQRNAGLGNEGLAQCKPSLGELARRPRYCVYKIPYADMYRTLPGICNTFQE